MHDFEDDHHKNYREEDFLDWHDYKAVEKFNEKYSLKWLRLYKKMMEARDKKDQNALNKARDAWMKHSKKDDTYRKKSVESCGYCWQ
jgi:hypothetical protein